MRSITIASGKGGVGKTTLSLNMGIALARMKRKVIVVDSDMSMANLGVMLGVEQAPISLHNVLRGELDVKDAIYDGPEGLKYVPAGLALNKTGRIDFGRLKEAVRDLEGMAEFVLVDSGPGLSQDAESALKASREVILVVTPDPSSLADAIKIKTLANRADVKITGIVLNMVTGTPEEIRASDVSTVLEAPVIMQMPYDIHVRRANAAQEPVVIKFPNCEYSKSIRYLAAKITGVAPADPSGTRVKISILQQIMNGLTNLFSGFSGKKRFFGR